MIVFFSISPRRCHCIVSVLAAVCVCMRVALRVCVAPGRALVRLGRWARRLLVSRGLRDVRLLFLSSLRTLIVFCAVFFSRLSRFPRLGLCGAGGVAVTRLRCSKGGQGPRRLHSPRPRPHQDPREASHEGGLAQHVRQGGEGRCEASADCDQGVPGRRAQERHLRSQCCSVLGADVDTASREEVLRE